MVAISTRKEHIQKCKKKAIQTLDSKGLENGWIEMINGLSKHPETLEEHARIDQGIKKIAKGELDSSEKMRIFIKGFN